MSAPGCQRNIARCIAEAGADHVLAITQHRPALHTRICSAFDVVERIPKAYQGEDASASHCEVEKDHGRIETRNRVVCDVLTCWYHTEQLWPWVRSTVMIESTCEIGETITTERRYYVSSLLRTPCAPLGNKQHAPDARRGLQ